MPDPETPETPSAVETPAPVAAEAQVAPRPRRSNPLWPVLGGVIAAGIGFGLAKAIPGGWPIADTSALQAQVDQLAADNAALKSRLEDLAKMPAADSGLADRVAALESRPAPADLSADLQALKDRVAQLSSAPGGVDGAALKALQDQVAALSAAPTAELQSAIEAAKADLQAATAEAEAKAQSLAKLAALRQIAAALDSGAPFRAALADLGAEAPAVLADNAGGLPTLQSLQASFPDAARAALEDARRADMGASWTDRIATFLQTQTGARSLAPRDGNDPDAILSRAQAALQSGDLPATLSELATLPEAAQPALADWQDQAQRRLEAVEAVAALSQALGG